MTTERKTIGTCKDGYDTDPDFGCWHWEKKE